MTGDKLESLRSHRRAMPVTVYVAARGDIALMQEYPDIDGERYFRIFIHPDDAAALISDIKAAVKQCRGLEAGRLRNARGEP